MMYRTLELEKLLNLITMSFKAGYPLGIYFYPSYDYEGSLSFRKMLIQVHDETWGPEIQFNWIGGWKEKPVCYRFHSSPESEIKKIQFDLDIDEYEEAKKIYMKKVTEEINELLIEYKKTL